MRRAHKMPFGARRGDTGVAFSLWAPAAKHVALQIDRLPTPLPMARGDAGWFRAHVDVPTGSRYRFRIDDRIAVPDPASRFQPEDVDGPSEVIDAAAYEWQDAKWRGRPWREAVIYELHVGAFSATGDYAGVRARLDDLVALGITAIELMPLADFAGSRNWGYDGVLPFAPDSRYGRPEELKALVDAAHARGLMVLLDVVYNHFGPEGNFLPNYAPAFFASERKTPWGAAINFDGDDSAVVREFFIHNALYWLEEFHFDGLRLDAVHAIFDDSVPDIVASIATRVAAGPGRLRQVHLVLESNVALATDGVQAPLRRNYRAQWHDEFHHALHVALTGESSGYYARFADAPRVKLAAALRGCTAVSLESVVFVQNHDQIGNRADGARLTQTVPAPAMRAAASLLLLAPMVPLLFMGEEWASRAPFAFFCDFRAPLAREVRAGRQREFARFPEFAATDLPDPVALDTFARAVLDWHEGARVPHAQVLALYRELLRIRHRELVPRLGDGVEILHAACVAETVYAAWRLRDGSHWHVVANLTAVASDVEPPPGALVYASDSEARAPADILSTHTLPPWTVRWYRHRP